MHNSNIFNNVFTLEYYLIKNYISTDIMQFAKENGLDINYRCYLQKQDDKHYLITIDYRLITISESVDENEIKDFRKHNTNVELYIVCNGLKITISKKYNSMNILADCNNVNIVDNIKYMDKIRKCVDYNGFINMSFHKFSSNIDLLNLKKIIINKEPIMYLIKDMNIEVIFCKNGIIPDLIENNWKSLTIQFPKKNIYDFTLCNNLEILELGHYDSFIPSIPTLKKLKVKYCINIDGMENLEVLEIKSLNFILNLNNFPKLRKLHIKDCNYQLDFSPNMPLTDLYLPKYYNYEIIFPLSLKYLTCGHYFKNGGKKLNLPPNLVYLKINSSVYPTNILNILTVEYTSRYHD